MNDRSPERWLAKVEATGLGDASSEVVSLDDHLRERIFTGLRLTAGLDLAELEDDLRVPVRQRFEGEVARLVREGLARREGSVVRLTERGLDLHSEAALRFF